VERTSTFGGKLDLDRFLSALESAQTVPFSGEFQPDGTFKAPYTGPGILALLGGDFPDGIEDGAFWASRVYQADRARYADGMAHQQRGESCQMEYRLLGLDGQVRWIRECARARKQADGCVLVDGVVIDVTHQKTLAEALEDELRTTRSQLDSVLAALDEYLYAWRYPAHGPASIDFESIDQATFLGLPTAGLSPEEEWLRSVHVDDRSLAADVLASQLAGESGSGEYRIVDRNGNTRCLLDRWTCRREAGGDVIAEGIVSDVTVLRDAQNELAEALTGAQFANDQLNDARLAAEHASNTDPLTGLANRRSFQRSLEQAVGAASEEPFGLILLDVDHFKRTNDTYGHQAGDDVLVAVVERMRRCCPPDALLARWGGEEFTVLVRGVRSPDALRAVAEAIRESVRGERLATRRGALAVTISCGGVLSRSGTDIDELVHAADAAMYRAKQTGRDRTRLAGDAASGSAEDRPELLLIAQSFAHTASIREGVPELHCAEVADLAGQIATRLDLPAATVLRCRLAGWLHDVGKITIPDRVLAKPGPLTDEEWRVMVTHAAFGADLVARTPGIAESASAVRHHHERWDGKGYPDRLAGTSIPIEARVVAAADTWNAMTHDRVYRRALGFEAACAELIDIAGSQLDPGIADALLAVVRDAREPRDIVPQAA
jgi:diguanylate cyclase (GGDEF)-like protein